MFIELDQFPMTNILEEKSINFENPKNRVFYYDKLLHQYIRCSSVYAIESKGMFSNDLKNFFEPKKKCLDNSTNECQSNENYLHNSTDEFESNTTCLRGSMDECESNKNVFKNLVNDYVITPTQVSVVMGQTGCSHQKAIYALNKHKGDLVAAILESSN